MSALPLGMVPEVLLGIGSSLNVFPCLDRSGGYQSGEFEVRILLWNETFISISSNPA